MNLNENLTCIFSSSNSDLWNCVNVMPFKEFIPFPLNRSQLLQLNLSVFKGKNARECPGSVDSETEWNRLQSQSLPLWICTHSFSLLQQYSQNYAADCATQAAGSRCTCRCNLNRANKSISAALWHSQVCLKDIYVSPLVRALGKSALVQSDVWAQCVSKTFKWKLNDIWMYLMHVDADYLWEFIATLLAYGHKHLIFLNSVLCSLSWSLTSKFCVMVTNTI